MTQGKRKDQIEFSSRVVFVAMIGIMLVFAFMLTSDSCNKFNKEVSEGIKNDPRPASPILNYLPPTFYQKLDTLENNLDSLDKRLDSLLKIEKKVDSILENIEPDFIYYDTTEVKREEDSIDAYVKHWYEVLDTNGDGQIDEHVMWIGGDGDTIWE